MKAKFLLLPALVFVSAHLVNAQFATVWGTTTSGGSANEGVIFNMKADGSDFTVAHNFSWPAGFMPMGNLLKASDGNLYGACEMGGDSGSCTLFQYKPLTDEYTDVYDFGTLWGDFPTSGVVEKEGILYGNSSGGGIFGGGVIYSYDITSGVYTDLYDLPWYSSPYNAPVFASNGILYGTTVMGGTNGNGSIYSFDPSSGTFTDVHDFVGETGFNPYSGLMSAIDGKVYGMTTYGGQYGKGIIFSVDPSDNTYQKLYDFDGNTGARPHGALSQGFDGMLYGMTTIGGADGNGVIFKFDPITGTCTKLYDFSTSDGTTPLGSLMQTGHYLCGTTSAGGTFGYGTTFYWDLQNNTFTKTFDFDGTNGAAPNGGFTMLSDEIATGVQSTNDNSFAVYPNPVTSYVICTLSSAENNLVNVKVIDISGKEMLNEMLQAKNSEVRIDLSGLSSGAYVLELISGDVKRSAKFTKQ